MDRSNKVSLNLFYGFYDKTEDGGAELKYSQHIHFKHLDEKFRVIGF